MRLIDRITPYHLDILKEVGNIGAGHAATSLSQLVNRPIDMKVPSVRVVPFDEIPELLGGAEKVVAAIFLRIEGEAPGSMFFLLPIDQAEKLVRQLTNNDTFTITAPPYDEMVLSSLQELGNILAGSYLTSFADFTNLKLHPSVPGINVDMAGALIDLGLVEISQASDYAIVIDTTVIQNDDSSDLVQGHFFYLPDPDAFKKILQALGASFDE